MTTQEHWQKVYSTKAVSDVSWYQPEARLSLELIERAAPSTDSAILDVGGGASTLVDGLLQHGYSDITVLDIAEAALEAARLRLGAGADSVAWIAANILEHRFEPNRYDLWHDRAVFHFLTERDDRRRYVEQMRRALRPGGHAVMATFAEDGPTKCSGLDVCRYSPQDLEAEIGGGFAWLEGRREEHITPGGGAQRFQYSVLRKLPEAR